LSTLILDSLGALILDSLGALILDSLGALILDSLSALILDSLVGRLILDSFSTLARFSSDLLLDRLSYVSTLDSFTTRLDSLVDRFSRRFKRLVVRHVFLVEY
jgi:hypothetical protein